jgi:2-dehydropantoate 2-reductase
MVEKDAILVVGTGAMACLFAGRISAAGYPVVMLGGWQEGIQALHDRGVTLVEADGSENTYPVRVTGDPAVLQNVPAGLVLVKSWQTRRAARQVAQFLSEDGVVLSLQNGIGNRELLAQILGAPRVALGVTTLGANLLAPGRVQAAGQGVVSLGIHSRLGPMAEKLRHAGFMVENAPDPDALLWGKLVINAAINPLTALLGVPNGELLTRPPARALMVTLAREAAAVAVAQGIRLPYPDPVVAAESIARRTGANLSSMLQDVRRGAPTEIDAICGAIVKAGEQASVPTPVNRTMWHLVEALVSSSAA